MTYKGGNNHDISTTWIDSQLNIYAIAKSQGFKGPILKKGIIDKYLSDYEKLIHEYERIESRLGSLFMGTQLSDSSKKKLELTMMIASMQSES